MLSPRSFIDDLKVLDLSGVGSRAIPNGLRELRTQRPYQAFYDERYFTRDAAPPPQQQQQPKAPPLGKSMSARSVGSSVSAANSSAPSPTNGKDKPGKEKKKGFLRF